jgi:hypothetical protein
MLPPQEIIDLVDVPPEPNLSFSPDQSQVLQLYRPSPLPPISELARPELKLAGGPLSSHAMQAKTVFVKSQGRLPFTVQCMVDRVQLLPSPGSQCELWC